MIQNEEEIAAADAQNRLGPPMCDEINTTAHFHFGFWERFKVAFNIAVSGRAAIHVRIPTEHETGMSGPAEWALHTDWRQRVVGGSIQIEVPRLPVQSSNPL